MTSKTNQIGNKGVPEILSNFVQKQYTERSPKFSQTTSKTKHKGSLKFFGIASKTIQRNITEILSTYFKNKTQGIPEILSNNFKNKSKREQRAPEIF